jgi:hypothetical protein
VPFACSVVGDVNRIAGSAGNLGDDGAIVVKDCVYQRGFSGIGSSNYDDLETSDARCFLSFAHGFSKWSQAGVECIQQGFDISPMGCGYANSVTEAKPREISCNVVEFLMVTLVDYQAYLFGSFAKLLSNGLVYGSVSFPGIYEKKYDVRSIDCDLCLSANGLGKVGISKGSDASGIHQVAGYLSQVAGGRDSVPGDPRLVMND